MIIRKESDSDKEKIWKVNTEAFETEEEANLVNAFRNSGILFTGCNGRTLTVDKSYN